MRGCVWTLAASALATAVAAQTPTMPSTLRYGSGLIDVPASSVLPHLHVTATYSGFFSHLGRRVTIDDSGTETGFGPGRDRFYQDGAFAIGLFDRLETGVSIQSLGDAADGGSVWGLFGRLRLWEPVDQGLGLAVGARYLTSPDFGDGGYAPGRLGFADERLRDRYTDARGLDSNLSPYVVGTAWLRGFDGGPLPENDLSFTLGYGGGMFRSGGDLDFYAPGSGNGWFVGSALHLRVAPEALLTLMAEHNGFDVNTGLHVDWEGIRVGVQYLASNHPWPADGHYSEYQRPKVGLLASIAVCPREPGLRCRPRAMRRVEPDTVYIPPPPPDTIVVGVAEERAPAEAGEATTVCLSTGQNVPIEVTLAGDTLVGTQRTPIRDLRPALQWSGTYAGDAFWYLDDQVIVFEGGDFRKSEDTFPIDCGQILRVGVHEGVPVFAVITARRPLDVIFIPVRPGVWHRYTR